ncbi:MAG TPA: hypothetical protein VK934_08345 [Fimbriimonas sp.]|nr:hypothetical protein [Fimbriimonas sp.]
MNSFRSARYSLLGLISLCSTSAFGQTLDWRSYFSAGANSYSGGQFLEVHPSGNIYVVGATAQSLGTSDLLFQRYNSTGTRLWTLTVDGGLQQDNPRDMYVDGQGDTYVAGDRNDAAPEATITKVASWGVVLWSYLGAAKTYQSIKQGSGGAVVACGTEDGGAQGDNIVLTQLNLSGGLNWQRSFNSGVSWDDVGKSVAVEGSGNIYVAGTSYPNATDAVMRVLKYSNTGSPLWAKSYTGPRNNAQAFKVVANPLGGCVVLGTSGTGADQNLVVSSYDTAGNLVWRDSYTSGANTVDVPVDLAINSASQVVVSGYGVIGAGNVYATTLLFKSDGSRIYTKRQVVAGTNLVPTSVALMADGTAYVSANVMPGGFSDAALIKYGPTGTRLFFTSFVVPGINEYANRVVADSAGRAVVVGAAQGVSTAYQDLMLFRIS